MPNQSPKLYDRAKIVKVVKESQPGKFQPTINDVVFWYDTLNEQLFAGELPSLSAVKFCKSKAYWAEAFCRYYKTDNKLVAEIKFSDHFQSFKEFVEIVAHEMIHIWEFKTFGVMGHGERFFSWSPELKKLGLNLYEKPQRVN
jgi:hypothetical protein